MDATTLTTAAAALAAVLGLVVLAARLLRSFGVVTAHSPAGSRRLGIVEVLPLDGRRRATLLRCDDQLLLLVSGGPQDLLVTLRAEAA
jgi:flagellar protein FliO/FliZ